MTERLTDAELDAIEGTFVETGTIYRAITELRELRAENKKLREAIVELQVNDADAHTVAVEQQDAALVAALEAVGDHEICDCPGTTCLVWLRAASALASVGGDA